MSTLATLFNIVVVFVIAQRCFELRIAKRNTTLLLKKGAIEFGKNHYWVLVSFHTLFFLSLIAEATLRTVHLSTYWPFFLSVLLLAQAGRIWTIRTLNGRWTTRIIVLPGKKLVDGNRVSPSEPLSVVCVGHPAQ